MIGLFYMLKILSRDMDNIKKIRWRWSDINDRLDTVEENIIDLEDITIKLWK